MPDTTTFYKKLVIGVFRFDGYSYENRHSHEAILASIVVTDDQQRIIDVAVAELKNPFPAMLRARHGEDFTHERIGRLFGISKTCSLNRINQAHKQLRPLLCLVQANFQDQIKAFWIRSKGENEHWRRYYQRKNELEEAMWKTLQEEFPDLVE